MGLPFSLRRDAYASKSKWSCKDSAKLGVLQGNRSKSPKILESKFVGNNNDSKGVNAFEGGRISEFTGRTVGDNNDSAKVYKWKMQRMDIFILVNSVAMVGFVPLMSSNVLLARSIGLGLGYLSVVAVVNFYIYQKFEKEKKEI